MNQLYPIVRRFRRPLLPVDPPAVVAQPLPVEPAPVVPLVEELPTVVLKPRGPRAVRPDQPADY